jgi:hypothetical protein
MLKDFVTASPSIHDEYMRRHANSPVPLEQPRHGLRKTIGETLIHLGERLAKVEPRPSDRAA